MAATAWNLDLILLSSVSILSTILTLIVCIRYLRSAVSNYALRIIYYLCLTNLIQSLNYLCNIAIVIAAPQFRLNETQSCTPICLLQASIQAYTTLSAEAWTFVAVWSILMILIKDTMISKDIARPLLHFCPYTIALPALAAIVPIFTNTYRAAAPETSAFCAVVLPCAAIFFLSVYVAYCGFKKHLSKNNQELTASLSNEEQLPVLKHVFYLFLLYPFFMLFGQVLVMASYFLNDQNSQTGQILINIGFPLTILQGALNSTVYLILQRHFMQRYLMSGNAETSSLVDNNFVCLNYSPSSNTSTDQYQQNQSYQKQSEAASSIYEM